MQIYMEVELKIIVSVAHKNIILKWMKFYYIILKFIYTNRNVYYLKYVPNSLALF